MPCSYCSFVGSSPTEAKWPFTVMTEGAVGYLEAADGLLEESPFTLGDGDDAIIIKVGRVGWWVVGVRGCGTNEDAGPGYVEGV